MIFKQRYEINNLVKSTWKFISKLFELLVSIIHTPPFVNNIKINIPTYSNYSLFIPIDLNIPISLLSEFRIYFLINFYFSSSKWRYDHAARICRKSNVSHGILFVLKAELKDHPFILISILFVLSFVVFGYSLSICEMCFLYNIPIRMFNDWTNLFNGLWCISTAMINLGYGDYNINTIVGRVLIILAPIWGLTILSYFLFSFISVNQMTSKEIKVYKEISNDKYKTILVKQGLNLILSYYQFNRILQFDSEDNLGLVNEISEKKEKRIICIKKSN